MSNLYTRRFLRLGAALAMLALLLIRLGPALAMVRAADAPPSKVVIAGTIQSVLGCPADWQPDCDKTALTFDAATDLWSATFELPAGSYEYKVALNGSWDENYGLLAKRGGANIPLTVSAPMTVTFIYDHKTHWVADSLSAVLATVAGSFQSEMGCAGDWQPECLATWMEDPEADGVYVFATTKIPPGNYEAKIAINQNLTENYGAGGAKDGANIPFGVTDAGQETYFGYNAKTHEIVISTEGAPRGDLGTARAQWVTRDTIAWKVGTPAQGTKFALVYAPDGGLKLEPGAITGGQLLPLQYNFGGLNSRIALKFPALAGYSSLQLDPADSAKVPNLLKVQLAVVAWDANGKLLDATTPQIPGVLDNLFGYSGPLGVAYSNGAPTLRVWAPTARTVTLHIFADARTTVDQSLPMTLDAASGVWTAAGAAEWTGQYYLYEVEVYVPSTGQVEHNLVTDPYSISLSTNSLRSQIVNLADPSLMPAGWDKLQKPALAAPEDNVIYELHIRDFSINDLSVPAAERGTYLAFTDPESNGMRHLKALAAAGLTTVHLLPAFDIASVDEDKTTWQRVDEAALAALPPDSDQQQAAVNSVKETDGFNWGYDPLHYTTPDGAYATDPEGSGRIRQFRQMVQALNGVGLRVVMDVVYNHTSASGQADNSVLDKVVPGYYHRLDADGQVETSTCCQNTASEHAMMEKLMIDSLVTWATAYKVDGFRFDLMGHHMLSNMVDVRAALDALTPASGGVDGKQIYVYGEGWDFGEVAGNARGMNATQLNIGGTGIGVFNDRLRDAARGGSPFTPPQDQGFVTGLFVDPNASDQGPEADQRAKLLQITDWLRVGLAGNLKNYALVDGSGHSTTAADIKYNDKPAGYTLDPQENIVYVSAHDNESLFDAIQWKAPAGASMAERVRMQNLAASLVLLAQGVPFFQAGDELLRSKSLDGNSYNSGDWFNRLDFTYQSNNWGVGLPPNGSDRWPAMKPLLADPALKPAPADIQAALAHFEEMLAIRRSSQLFRLRTADEVIQRLKFFNTGPNQTLGLIVMGLENSGDGRLADAYDRILVIFNSNPDAKRFADPVFAGADFKLHPLQQSSHDPVVRGASYDTATGAFMVPGRTAAVFAVSSKVPSSTRPSIIPNTLALAAAAVVIIVGGLYAWTRRTRSARG